MAAFHVAAQRDEALYLRGSANALAIEDGELWRTLTALTLHADFAHLLANALSSLVFVTLLCRWIGPGAGLSLTVLAGALGNAMASQ